MRIVRGATIRAADYTTPDSAANDTAPALSGAAEAQPVSVVRSFEEVVLPLGALASTMVPLRLLASVPSLWHRKLRGKRRNQLN